MSESTVENAGHGEETEKTFSQEALDGILQKRLAKFADYDDVKAENVTLKEQAESNAGVEEVRNEVRNELLPLMNKRIINAEAKAIAAEMQFHYPNDAYLYINLNNVSIGEDGIVDVESIEKQLKESAEQRPALVRSDTVRSAADAGLGVHGTPTKKTTGQMFADALSG